MAYCAIGQLNQRKQQAVGGCAVRVEGKDCICPNQGKPLAVWVRTRYAISADAFGITELCIDCYKNIYGSPPMPRARLPSRRPFRGSASTAAVSPRFQPSPKLATPPMLRWPGRMQPLSIQLNCVVHPVLELVDEKETILGIHERQYNAEEAI